MFKQNNIFNYFVKDDNTVEVCRSVFSLLGKTISHAKIKSDLYLHADYPSLLSISDTLSLYGINNISFKTNWDNLAQLPTPMIVPIRPEGMEEQFAIIRQVYEDTVVLTTNTAGKDRKISKSQFERTWISNVVTVIDPETSKDKIDTDSSNSQSIKPLFVKILTIISIIVCMYVALGSSIVGKSIFGQMQYYLFFTLSIVGLLISCVTIIYEIDESSSLSKQVCQKTTTIDCKAVLNSKAARLWGQSLSVWGAIYFIGQIFLLLTAQIYDPKLLVILAWISLVLILFSLYALYYQAYVIKQWCKLCIAVHIVILTQCIITLFSSWHLNIDISLIGYQQTAVTILLFMLPYLLFYFLIPFYKTFIILQNSETALLRIKRDPDIFFSLLNNQVQPLSYPSNLGIKIGSSDSRHKILKVCNPFCGPCAKAHPVLEELASTLADVELRIIFTSSGEPTDKHNRIIRHLMALSKIESSESFTSILNDWYADPSKDYESFSEKYPLSSELSHVDNEIIAMRNWCIDEHISYTPTIFIDEYRMPKMYSIEEVSHILKQNSISQYNNV